MSNKILYAGLIVIALVVIVVAWGIITEPVVDSNNLAECLTEKGVIMAGTDWCPACQEQKRQFGESFEKINYKNCDYEEQWCLNNNISGFPTWVFPDGTQYRGVQNLGFLQETAECNLDIQDTNITIACGCGYCQEEGCTCEDEGQTCSFPDYNACAGNCDCTSESCSA